MTCPIGEHPLARDRWVRYPHRRCGMMQRSMPVSLPAHPVIERYQTVWIWLGASARDESTLPDFGFIAISAHAGSVE